MNLAFCQQGIILSGPWDALLRCSNVVLTASKTFDFLSRFQLPRQQRSPRHERITSTPPIIPPALWRRHSPPREWIASHTLQQPLLTRMISGKECSQNGVYCLHTPEMTSFFVDHHAVTSRIEIFLLSNGKVHTHKEESVSETRDEQRPSQSRASFRRCPENLRKLYQTRPERILQWHHLS